MSTKELVIETIRDLPEGASWHEIEERIHFLAAVESAREEVRRGDVMPREEIRGLIDTWIFK